MIRRDQISMWGDTRMSLDESLELTAGSLNAYGERYNHWAIAYSGGKDSSATVTAVCHLIDTGRVKAPKSLTVIYADTRMELPPLHNSAMRVMEALRERGIRTKVVLPLLDKRFFVYMFGKGVPPSHSGFRWCTGALKVDPMTEALRGYRDEVGEKFLMLTGVRLGESAQRDARINLSCSKDGAECGQGYFQQATPASVADTLAPLIHWRVCNVWDWLMGRAPELGFHTGDIAHVYGQDEDGSQQENGARTGCVGCPVAGKETALDAVLRIPKWAYLAPLRLLKPLYERLSLPQYRLRRDDKTFGPLVMEARRWGLEQILDIQQKVNDAAHVCIRPEIDLINEEEHRRILELIAANTWPDKWTGDEMRGDALVSTVDGEFQIMRGGALQGVMMP